MSGNDILPGTGWSLDLVTDGHWVTGMGLFGWSLGGHWVDFMNVSLDKDPSRKRRWRLDGYYGGRRIRLFFLTEAEARAEMRRLQGERVEAGPIGDRLSPKERIIYAELRDQVAAAGGTLEEAVAFWLLMKAPPSRPMRLWDLLEAAIAAKDGEGKSSRYLEQLRSSVGQLCRWRGLGERWAHEIYGDAISEWVEGNGWAAKTRRNYLIDVRTVFEWGKAQGVVRANPTDGIALPPAVGGDEVPVLSPMDVARLVVRCLPRAGWFEGRNFPELLPYVVLGCFAGLRTERELGELSLDKIDLEEGVVIVDAARAKSRSRRVVDLSPNAVALLRMGLPVLVDYWRGVSPLGADLKLSEMGLCPRNFRRRWEALRWACGWRNGRRWDGNAMRHSFASYHYALHQNEAMLKAQMGHSLDSHTLWQHYRRRVSRREAVAFWRIGLGLDAKKGA